jgi:hypothetical protein
MTSRDPSLRLETLLIARKTLLQWVDSYIIQNELATHATSVFHNKVNVPYYSLMEDRVLVRGGEQR